MGVILTDVTLSDVVQKTSHNIALQQTTTHSIASGGYKLQLCEMSLRTLGDAGRGEDRNMVMLWGPQQTTAHNNRQQHLTTADNIAQQQTTDNQTAHVIIIVFACPYLDTVLCKPTRGSTTQVLLSMSEALIQGGNLNKSFREFSLGL